MVSPDVWFCCLLPDDAGAVVSTSASFVAGLNQPIERGAFDAIWSSTALFTVGGIDAVLLLYGLEHTVIIVEDAPPIPAVGIAMPLLWLEIEWFIFTGAAGCWDGCDTPTFTLP